MPDDDHYTVLGVPADADGTRIRVAYLAAMRASHPDVAPDVPGSGDRARAANAAWEVLRDPVRRAAFDRRRAVRSGAATRPGSLDVDVPGDHVVVVGRAGGAEVAARREAQIARHRGVAERFHRASLRVALTIFGASTLVLLLVAAR